MISFFLMLFLWIQNSNAVNYYLMQHSEALFHYWRLRAVLGAHVQDPFEQYTLEQRVNECDKYLNSNISRLYTYEGTEMNALLPPDPRRISPTIPVDIRSLNFQLNGYNANFQADLLKYRPRRMKVNALDIESDVKMFPCLIWDEVEVYLTYGFQPDYTFVIETFSDHVLPLKFSLFMEPAAEVDELISQERTELNQCFWTSIGMTHPDASGSRRNSENRNVSTRTSSSSPISWIPKEMELCHISEFEHLRLCCSVAENLRLYPIFELIIRETNLIRLITGRRCVTKIIRNDQRTVEVYGDVLPCAINGEWTMPQFYLLRNTSILGTIFVLRALPYRSNQLRMEALVKAERQLRDLNFGIIP